MTDDFWVLCVDDDEKVLSGLELRLGFDFDVLTATSGAAGLVLLDERPNCAVVISDMRMPEMNGSEFLAKARLLEPDTTRMLLTGYSDVSDTIDAVNDGGIFRFLTKPAPAEALTLAVEAGIRQWQLVQSERVLLEQTLHGAAETLIEALEIASPDTFARSRRVEAGCRHVATLLGVHPVWEVTLAGLLMRIGWISLPDEVVADLVQGRTPNANVAAMLDDARATTLRLIGRIPRLDGVASIVSEASSFEPPAPSATMSASSIVRAVAWFDEQLRLGVPATAALAKMADAHDVRIIAALESWPLAASAVSVREVNLQQLVVGMTTAGDIVTPKGNLLVKTGVELGETLVQRLKNFARTHGVVEPIVIAAS